MPQVIHHSRVALAYARSLMELASETGGEVAIGAELEGVAEVVAENKAFQQYLRDPGVSTDERAKLFRNVFGGRVSPLVLNTLLVLNDKGRARHLEEVCEAYSALLDEKLGKIEVDVTVASTLGPAELDEVRQLVNRALKKDAVVHQYVDETIIGGLVLKVGDRLIDGSVRTQLDQMREKLLASRRK